MDLVVESAVRELCRSQHGLISKMQARERGLSAKALRHRVSTGRLRIVHPGVYADTTVPSTWRQRVMAAVLAGGRTAFASHATAAQLWGLWPVDDTRAIEFTTVLERAPRVVGVRAHRSGLLIDADVRKIDVIPVASMERTVLDLSGRLTVNGLGRLTDDAIHKRHTTYGRIVACLERLPWAPGHSPERVRDMLASRLPEFGLRESWLEEFVFDALQRYELPLPQTQVQIVLPSGRRRLDKCYADERLVLESDGFDPHSTRRAFDDDRLRNNELLLAGYRVLHFTSEFTDYEVACTVAAALGLIAPEQAPEGPLTFKQWCGGRQAVLCSARGSGGRSAR